MNISVAAKKFFSFFVFFDNERDIKRLKEKAATREKIYKQKIEQQEKKISQLIKKIDCLN